MERTNDGTTDAGDSASGADRHWSQVTQRHYDPDANEELTTTIIYAVAEAQGVSPDQVRSPPLYESVDVSAIENAFFGPTVAGESRQGLGTVEFRYTDYLLTVGSDGWVHVYQETETDRS